MAPDNPFQRSDPQFTVTPLETVFNIDDAGVGDLNGDGRPDLWTTNHSAHQWLALANHDHGFQAGGIDVLALHQEPRIPGIAAMAGEPQCATPGKRLFVEGAQIVLKHNDGSAQGAFSGELHLPWPSRVHSRGNAKWEALACPSDLSCTKGHFRIAQDSELRLDTIPARSDGFPINVTIDPSVPLAEVQLGRLCAAPGQHQLEFALKDRHGLLLADLSGSSGLDLFISRGGARGRLEQVHPGALDELRVWQNGQYREGILETEIKKEGCPGRQVGAVDIDRDGDLDIYQVCGRSEGMNSDSPNRLYIQIERGKFEERGKDWGLALEGAGTFAWVPSPDPENAVKMVWATADSIRVFELEAQRYRETWSSHFDGDAEDPLLVGDLQGKGDFSVARISKKGSTLLELSSSSYKLIPFSELGLPQQSAEGDLVDFNGDGKLDLFLVPQGLFQRQDGNQWTKSNILQIAGRDNLREARSTWFDADQDGDLDLWLTLKDSQLAPRVLRWPLKVLGTNLGAGYTSLSEAIFGPMTWQLHMWQSVFVENQSERPTHAELKILGPPGNSQGIGARITGSGGGLSINTLVGQTDGSRLSQTLNTAYLGVADIKQLNTLSVRFPDGTVVTHQNPDINNLPVFQHPDAVKPVAIQN
ncbi:MAG: VCBS repeat-containing protein [Oleiphilaceae bacterium]|nr:VCBS repeat-containing protein [Oleiphilaceae bacterium]